MSKKSNITIAAGTVMVINNIVYKKNEKYSIYSIYIYKNILYKLIHYTLHHNKKYLNFYYNFFRTNPSYCLLVPVQDLNLRPTPKKENKLQSDRKLFGQFDVVHLRCSTN